MELLQVFKRTSELTAKYPNLGMEELKELRTLSKGISVECTELIYQMLEKNIEENDEKK